VTTLLGRVSSRLAPVAQRARIAGRQGPRFAYHYGRWRLRRAADRLPPGALRPRGRDADAVETGAARGGLVAAFRARPHEAFFVAPGDADAVLALVGEGERSRTIRAAEAICRGEFAFRGRPPVVLPGELDWEHDRDRDVEWWWDLNRHGYFVTLGRATWYTGDAAFGRHASNLAVDWLARHGALSSAAWSNPFEVAFRATAWTWTLQLLVGAGIDDERTLGALLAGLAAFGRRLDRDLEFHVPNNHLLLEAKALAQLGLQLGELPGAERWVRRGLRIVEDEVRRQVGPDGVHRERSSQYQRIIGGELLELLVALERAGRPAPPGVVERFGRMVEFELALRRPDGSYPLLGDAADDDPYYRVSAAAGGPRFLGREDLLAVAPSLDEGSAWLFARRAVTADAGPARPPSRLFRAGGYAVMRAQHPSGERHLVVDCGAFGYRAMPSHGHADALAFELFASGHPFAVDAGGSAMADAEWRNYLRGTAAHNTITIDGRDQSELVGLRHVDRAATTRIRSWSATDDVDWLLAAHDGYRRAAGVLHSRSITFVRPSYWLIHDLLEPVGDARDEHLVESFLHLPPRASVSGSAGERAVVLETGERLDVLLRAPGWAVDVVEGQEAPMQGWLCPTSGVRCPAPVLRFSTRAKPPLTLSLVIAPVTGASLEASSPWAVTAAGRLPALGITVSGPAFRDDLLVDHLAGRMKRGGRFRTDALLTAIRRDADGAETVLAHVGGSRLERTGTAAAEVGVG
jgi:uncharacterized heparinase superfamily protein